MRERERAAFLYALTSKPELALYERIYEGPGFREYLQRNTKGQQAAQFRFQLRSGTSTLRHHDSRFRDQPSYDTEDRICAACGEPDSIESVHHVLLHCPAYAQSRASLRAEIARLPAAHGSPPLLTDEEGVIAFLRDDFMGAQKRRRAQWMPFCMLLRPLGNFAWSSLGDDSPLTVLAYSTCLPCMLRLRSCVAAPERGGPLP